MNDITRHLSNRVGIERFHSQLHNILQHLLNYVDDFENTFHMVSSMARAILNLSIKNMLHSVCRTIYCHTWICLDQMQIKQ